MIFAAVQAMFAESANFKISQKQYKNKTGSSSLIVFRCADMQKYVYLNR